MYRVTMHQRHYSLANGGLPLEQPGMSLTYHKKLIGTCATWLTATLCSSKNNIERVCFGVDYSNAYIGLMLVYRSTVVNVHRQLNAKP